MGLAISLENISKAYQLGTFNTGSFKSDISRWWAIKRGKEDPLLMAGEENDRTIKSNSNVVWSLKDINLEIKQGATLGIVGKNGAGKSTLLKILSQITHPTTGQMKIKGKVASLLEVGTGFHPELTGYDNIFLNGSILGMKKAEIKRKLDEIIAFSGVERYIDTPVKRYSSGMFVRLAFAVAAHLESEILIVDEVLAVGDVEFQKKCLGKLDEINSEQGRTVLYVSHNMPSVKSFCKEAVHLVNGRIIEVGDVETIIHNYMGEGIMSKAESFFDNTAESKDQSVSLIRAAAFAENKKPGEFISTSDPVVIEVDFKNRHDKQNLDVTIDVFNADGIHVTHFGMVCNPNEGLKKGEYRTSGVIPGGLLNENRYIFNITIGRNQREVLITRNDEIIIQVEDNIETRGNNFAKLPGVIHPIIPWRTELI